MKKKIIFMLGGLIVIGVGYWLISPLFITKRVDEKLEDITPTAVNTAPTPVPVANDATPVASVSNTKPAPASKPEIATIRQGMFVGLAGHNGAGTAKLIRASNKWHVRFEDDFKVTNGPDLFVYLGQDGQYAAEARLAALKGNVGGQNYEVPANINPENYNEVWVWCRAFSVPFAKAELK